MAESLYPNFPILLVDDEQDMLIFLEDLLISLGITNVKTCSDSRKVMAILKTEAIPLILLDLMMPHISGNELVTSIKQELPDTTIIIASATNDLNDAVSCLKKGVYDFLTKPVDLDLLSGTVNNAIEVIKLKQENSKLKKTVLNPTIENPSLFSPIITDNKQMFSIFEYIEAIAGTSEPVFITGESGVGKDLIAKAVHATNARSGKMLSVNVSGLDTASFSDTLFGHKKGAFTNADSSRNGLIEEASHGTLFLDEIGDLSIQGQLKLLRLLQEKEYFALGTDQLKLCTAHIIAATNADMEKLNNPVEFRKDLFFRLCIHHIHIPPLRERKDDIPLLVDYFIKKASESLNKKAPEFSYDIYSYLMHYDFPGNIRELRSIIYNAVSKIKNNDHTISLEEFKSGLSQFMQIAQANIAIDQNNDSVKDIQFPNVMPSLKALSNLAVQEALKRTDGSQVKAAQLLGISPQALSKRLKG